MDLEKLKRLRQRLSDILDRHVVESDHAASDDEFVRAVMGRYEKSRLDYIIDVGE